MNDTQRSDSKVRYPDTYFLFSPTLNEKFSLRRVSQCLSVSQIVERSFKKRVCDIKSDGYFASLCLPNKIQPAAEQLICNNDRNTSISGRYRE